MDSMTQEKTDKRARNIFVTILLIGYLSSMLCGCATYGKKPIYIGETCDKCQQELHRVCTPFTSSGRYKCKCVNCGKVYKYYLGKQVEPKAVEANPKGIKTPLEDKFNEVKK